MRIRRGAPLCEAGVTLIETLVVLAILGLLVAAVAVPLNASWQRARLESSAGDIRNFLQVAYTQAMTQHTAITVTLQYNGATGIWTFLLTPPPVGAGINGALATPGSLTVPSYISSIDGNADTTWPRPAGTRTLICDPMGRTLDPTSGQQVTTTQTLAVTHVNMADGSLTPYVEYDIQVFPLWNVISQKVLR